MRDECKGDASSGTRKPGERYPGGFSFTALALLGRVFHFNGHRALGGFPR